MSTTIPIIHDGGWSTSTYPGDPDRPEFTVEYRRYNEGDRALCARWEAEAWSMIEEGLTEETIVAVLSAIKRGAMCARLRNPGGEPWTDETLADIGGASQKAFDFLEDLLYRPFWQELTLGARRQRLGARAQSRLRIQLELRSLAASV